MPDSISNQHRSEDVHLLQCSKCGAPDEWIAIFDRTSDDGVVWDCHCDKCHHEWTEVLGH